MARKPILHLLEQTDDLVREASWMAPVAEDGGNIEGNYRDLARRCRALFRWTETTKHGGAAAEVLRLLNGAPRRSAK